jgi:hypothetical protein
MTQHTRTRKGKHATAPRPPVAAPPTDQRILPTDEGIRLRLRMLVDKYADGNATEFCRQIEVPRRGVLKVLAGETPFPGLYLIRAIADRFPHEDVRWLLTGRALTQAAVQAAARAEAVSILRTVTEQLADRKVG